MATYGIVRLISQVWAIPGRLKLIDQQVHRIRLRPTHPRTREVCRGFHPLLVEHHLDELLRKSERAAFSGEILAAGNHSKTVIV